MSLTDKITRLTTARSDIRTALSDKGIDASESGFEDFADDIGNISLTANGSVVSLQPDWEQNDETAADYIKNRPFYYEPIWVDENAFIEYDGRSTFPIHCSLTLNEFSNAKDFYDSNQTFTRISSLEVPNSSIKTFRLNNSYQICVNNDIINVGLPVRNNNIFGYYHINPNNEINFNWYYSSRQAISLELGNDDIKLCLSYQNIPRAYDENGNNIGYEQIIAVYVSNNFIQHYVDSSSNISLNISLKYDNKTGYHTLLKNFLPVVDQINSSDYAKIPSVGAVQSALSKKQDTLNFDSYPKRNSSNILTSGAIYSSLSNKQEKLYFDNIPTENSYNLVYSNGIYITINQLKSQINNLNNTISTLNKTIKDLQQRVYLLEQNNNSDSNLNITINDNILSASGDEVNVKNNILSFNSSSVSVVDNKLIYNSISQPNEVKGNTLQLNTAQIEDNVLYINKPNAVQNNSLVI